MSNRLAWWMGGDVTRTSQAGVAGNCGRLCQTTIYSTRPSLRFPLKRSVFLSAQGKVECLEGRKGPLGI